MTNTQTFLITTTTTHRVQATSEVEAFTLVAAGEGELVQADSYNAEVHSA